MRNTFKKLVATMLAAIVVVSPTKAWASGSCDRYEQVESHATGGDYVGGLLMYETMGTVNRTIGDGNSTTGTGSAGTSIPGSPLQMNSTISATTTSNPTTVTTQEPVGYYAMVDGSIYMIDCITNENKMIAGPRG